MHPRQAALLVKAEELLNGVKKEEFVTKVGEAELCEGDGSVHFTVEHRLSTTTPPDGDVFKSHIVQIKGTVSHYGYAVDYSLPRLPRNAVMWLIEALKQSALKMADDKHPEGAFDNQYAVEGSDIFPHRLPTWEERHTGSGEG